MEKIIEKIIEKTFEDLIKKLKPEIIKRAVFRFSDEIIKTPDGKMTRASCVHGMNPSVITIYSKVIAEDVVKYLPTLLPQCFDKPFKDILSHEIIHTFTTSEKEAYGKQDKVNFFKDNNKNK